MVLNTTQRLLPHHVLSRIIQKVRPNIKNRVRFTLSLFTLSILLLSYYYWTISEEEIVSQSNQITASPKVNDLYFIDFRVISQKLRPREKYRLAKVIDITGDVVSLVYSDFYYFRQREIVEAIRFGHLRFNDYFQGQRHNFSKSEIRLMFDNKAIYMAKRPLNNELYDNFVSPSKEEISSDVFIPGKSQNQKGLALLNAEEFVYLETKDSLAFKYFQQSAEYGYDQGQINLAEMYLNGQYIKKDLTKTLFWLKQASLQGTKAAIIKYGIVCPQVESCNLYDFYQDVITSGVNLKVRNLDFKLSIAK